MEENDQNENQPKEQVTDSHPISVQNKNGKGLAIASLVLGIVSVIVAWWGFAALFSVATSIVGIVLGVMAKKTMPSGETGIATAGLVISIIGLCLSVLIFIACVSCIGIGSRGFSNGFRG